MCSVCWVQHLEYLMLLLHVNQPNPPPPAPITRSARDAYIAPFTKQIWGIEPMLI